MDFVVAGFGAGAFAVLVGLLVRDYGGVLFRLRRARPRSAPRDVAARRRVFARAQQEASLILVGGGLLLLIATVILLIANASDQTGGLVVMAINTVLIVVFVGWLFWFSQRYAPRPLLRPRSADHAATPTRAAGKATPDAPVRAVSQPDTATGKPVRFTQSGAASRANPSPGEPLDDLPPAADATAQRIGEPQAAATRLAESLANAPSRLDAQPVSPDESHAAPGDDVSLEMADHADHGWEPEPLLAALPETTDPGHEPPLALPETTSEAATNEPDGAAAARTPADGVEPAAGAALAESGGNAEPTTATHASGRRPRGAPTPVRARPRSRVHDDRGTRE